MNIFSGSEGLGGALTNPTELAFRKRRIRHHYPVVIAQITFADAEAAYHSMKTGDVVQDDELMALVICEKFLQHPKLLKAVNDQGGEAFLRRCTHYTYARSEALMAWEGRGMDSRFIRNLVAGYLKAVAKEA